MRVRNKVFTLEPTGEENWVDIWDLAEPAEFDGGDTTLPNNVRIYIWNIWSYISHSILIK